jgi:hypothetical protein
MPMTPSEFGSDQGSPYCSPRPLQHAEPCYMSTSASSTNDKTHATSGVDPSVRTQLDRTLTYNSVDEHKIEQLKEPSVNERRDTHAISSPNLQL